MPNSATQRGVHEEGAGYEVLLPTHLRGRYSKPEHDLLDSLALVIASHLLEKAESGAISPALAKSEAPPTGLHPRTKLHKVVEREGCISKLEAFVLVPGGGDLIHRAGKAAARLKALPDRFDVGHLRATLRKPHSRRRVEYWARLIEFHGRAFLVRAYSLADFDHSKIEFTYASHERGQVDSAQTILREIGTLQRVVLGQRPRLLEVTKERHPAAFEDPERFLIRFTHRAPGAEIAFPSHQKKD